MDLENIQEDLFMYNFIFNLQIADAFAISGIAVYLIDLRGFGYSGGARGTATVDLMHQDIEILL